jgi:surfactin synthase thioesterase subunit
MITSKWLTRFSKAPDAACRLVLFPHAGGGAAGCYKLAKLMPDWLEVVAVVPPGREARMREQFVEQISDMAQGAINALAELPDRPQVFFGHSMGAMIAFEAAHMLAGAKLIAPRHLFLSGRRAPGPVHGETPLSRLPAEAFVDAIASRYGGIPRQIMDDKELLDLFLPVIRADIATIERYSCPTRPPLDVTMTLIGGTADPQCTGEAWAGWGSTTTKHVEHLRFAGDHFYLQSQLGPLAEALILRIQSALDTL